MVDCKMFGKHVLTYIDTKLFEVDNFDRELKS